jgi:hypothetical protein
MASTSSALHQALETLLACTVSIFDSRSLFGPSYPLDVARPMSAFPAEGRRLGVDLRPSLSGHSYVVPLGGDNRGRSAYAAMRRIAERTCETA